MNKKIYISRKTLTMLLTIPALIFSLVVMTPSNAFSKERLIKIGFFEGGVSPYHNLLRTEFRKTVEILNLDRNDNIKIQFSPLGFKTALWVRDSSKAMAQQLTENKDIDIVVCLGPWVVEDLLEANFDRPIIAMHRLSPIQEKLIGKNNRPIADNLTFQIYPEKIKSDLITLTELLKPKKLGFLFFPSSDEQKELMSKTKVIGAELGVEIVTGEGFNNSGTYAFFKAYFELKKQKVDAIYAGPLWGMDLITTSEFLKMIIREKVPLFAYEGNVPVQKGALASNSLFSHISETKIAAEKLFKILDGTTPAKLPIYFEHANYLSINMGTANQLGIEIENYLLNDASLLNSSPFEEVSTIVGVVARTKAQNPGLLASSEKLNAIGQKAKLAFSEYLPEIDYKLSLFQNDDKAVNNSHNWLNKSGYSSRIELRQKLFSLETIKEIKSASIMNDLEKSSFDDHTLSLELLVLKSMINLYGSQQLYELYLQNENHLKLYEETARLTNILENKESSDVVKWKREVYGNISRKINSRFDYRISDQILKTIQNLPPDFEIGYDFSIFSPQEMVKGQREIYNFGSTNSKRQRLVNFFYDKATENNSKIKYHDKKIQFNRSLVSINKAKYFPEFNLRANYNIDDQYRDITGSFIEEKNSWSIYGELSFPIFKGTSRQKESKRLKYNLSESEFRKDSVSLELMGNISRLLNKISSLTERAPITYQHSLLARKSLDIVFNDYKVGKALFIELKDAQNQVFTSEAALLEIRLTYFEAVAELIYEMGMPMADDSQIFLDRFIKLLELYYQNSLN